MGSCTLICLRPVPCKATKINTVARAPRDIATGRKALGCFSMVDGFISPPYGFAVGGRVQRPGDNCIVRQLSMRDMLIPVRCKRWACRTTDLL